MFSGDQLAAARVAAGLTQAALARRIGTTPARIGEWERAMSQPQARLMGRLVTVLGVPARDWLAKDLGAPTLGDLRKCAGLTVDEVVEAAGISLRLYRSLETGKRVNDPPAQAVRALATLLVLPPRAVIAAVEAARDPR